MLLGQETDGEFGQFGGAGEFAESVNGYKNSAKVSARNAGGGSIVSGGEGAEGGGRERSRYGFESLDIGAGGMVETSTGQPPKTTPTSEPAEMGIL